MNLNAGRWGKKSLPDLNQERSNHAALGLGEQVFVACGACQNGELSSVEMLRLGAKAWELIDIPDLSPRTNPVFSQITSFNICILGGKGENYKLDGVIMNAKTGAVVTKIEPKLYPMEIQQINFKCYSQSFQLSEGVIGFLVKTSKLNAVRFMFYNQADDTIKTILNYGTY